MSRYWWNDTDERIQKSLNLFKSVRETVTDAGIIPDVEEQITDLETEIERRKRARALPAIRFGKKVEVSEQLPECAACATPPVGMTGTSLGEEYPGATAVQFSRAALYPRDDEDDDERDPHIILFMPNYSIVEKSIDNIDTRA
jgi:hypothetical protein